MTPTYSIDSEIFVWRNFHSDLDSELLGTGTTPENAELIREALNLMELEPGLIARRLLWAEETRKVLQRLEPLYAQVQQLLATFNAEPQNEEAHSAGVHCCFDCEDAALKDGRPFDRRFIVCPRCGNKRCPKATNHNNACTGSNEPGQPGSRFVRTFNAEPAATQRENEEAQERNMREQQREFEKLPRPF